MPGSVAPGGMNATEAVRSGEAAGRLVLGSMNENTNRLGPTACWVLTITGITLGLPAEAELTARPRAEAGGFGVAGAQATTTATRSTANAATIDRDIAQSVSGDRGIRPRRVRVECRRRSARASHPSSSRSAPPRDPVPEARRGHRRDDRAARDDRRRRPRHRLRHGLPRLAAVPQRRAAAARRLPGVARVDPPHGRGDHRLRDPGPRDPGRGSTTGTGARSCGRPSRRCCWSASRPGSGARPCASTTPASR